MKNITLNTNYILVSALIAVGFIVGVMFGGVGERIVRATGLGPADLTVADSDEEWLQLIDEARERVESADLVFPDPRLGEDVIRVDSCAAIPTDAVKLEQMAELSTNEAAHRTIVLFGDPEQGTRYALFLRSDMKYPDCSEDLQRLAAERPAIFDAVDAHVCDEMELMARGEERSDVTLRQASPDVAQAYRDTFCGEEQ